MMMAKKVLKEKQGFTLVELIVVLVILGVLAAIMVPALLGWIDKSRNQSAILECRNVVHAAQACIAEAYGAGTLGEGKGRDEQFLLDNEDEIRKTADAAGDVERLRIGLNGVESLNNLITYLAYTTNNVHVVYQYDYNPKYRIVSDATAEYSVPAYERFINNALKNPDAWSQKAMNESHPGMNWYNEADRIQQYFKDYYGGVYPNVTSSEIALIPSGVKGIDSIKVNGNNDPAVWKPILLKTGEIILAVDTKKPDTAGANIGGANAGLIYYDGNYYYHNHTKGNSTQVSAAYVDMDFAIGKLNAEEQEWTLIGPGK